jgi:hypothetical protein
VSENNLCAKFYKMTRGHKQLQIEEENWERLAGWSLKSCKLLEGSETICSG